MPFSDTAPRHITIYGTVKGTDSHGIFRYPGLPLAQSAAGVRGPRGSLMRQDIKILSLVVMVATLCAFLLSGCGAQVCAFGNIGECPKTNKFANANGTSTGGNLSAKTTDGFTTVAWGGGRKTIQISGGRTPYTCVADQGGVLGTCTLTSVNTCEFVSASGSGTTSTAFCIIRSADYDTMASDIAPKNQGKSLRFPLVLQ